MAERPQYPILTPRDAAIPIRVSQVVGHAMAGKTNNVVDYVAPGAWASPVTVVDERITPFSFVGVQNVGGSPVAVSVAAIRNGEVDISWTSGTPTLLRLLIVG